MNIAVIGDSVTVTGFELAGITDTYVSKSQDAPRVLEEILRKDYKVVVITENLAAFVKKQISQLREKAVPIIVEIPDKKGSTGYAKQSLEDTIRRAVGIDISKKEA